MRVSGEINRIILWQASETGEVIGVLLTGRIEPFQSHFYLFCAAHVIPTSPKQLCVKRT